MATVQGTKGAEIGELEGCCCAFRIPSLVHAHGQMRSS